MKLFRIRGGIHPDDCKTLSAAAPIEDVPLPALLHVPLQQHIGAPAMPVVARGQRVLKGECIARGQGQISASVHAPTSGRIVGVGAYHANHPSGLSVATITLQPDGEDCWIDTPVADEDPFGLPGETIARRVAEAGIVGMGGATFPSSVKLNLRERYALHTLVINAAECEPYLTCDDRLMREFAAEVVDGSRLMAHALGVAKIVIGIEKNKPEAIEAMTRAAADWDGVQVVGLPLRYPMGSEKHLVQTLIGLETPARALTADIGVVVHNVATAYAVHDALRKGRPLISRIVTVSGGAVRRPANLRVALGTPLAHLVEHCGGFSEEPARLISGGPMMGQPVTSLKAPVVKGNNGLLALTQAETHMGEEGPCIRCASCVQACPCGLVPLEMAARIRSDELDAAVGLGLVDCVACGSCSYVCPSSIPLVQYFNYAKGELAARQRAKQKQLETKRLAELRNVRLEEQKRKKREAMARQREAAAAAKAAAQAQAEPVEAGA